ncbi:hypothetical protein DFH28DRAFT_877983 [Melampsora americana]|nr:hypothetical protein DFH28DRAFT_902449 [Melampsora americana]KAH9824791.1 hypothetical protein DFH28DRAFT_877983 [Melampsora americana]
MSRTERRQASHPCRVSYLGECGEEGPAPKPISTGFLSHHAAIVTAGMNGGSSFANGCYLTSYGSQADSLTPGGLYAMNCKMIGTNDKNEDHLHFENASRIDLGTVDSVGINVTSELMDKIAMTAMGIIVAKDVIQDPLYKGKQTVIATLKHTDYDPFTRMSVSWCTRHFIPPMKNMESAQKLCVVGREAQFTGYIKDYNAEKFMWECETTSISITSGHLTEPIQTPIKAAGRPTGGRVPLSVRPRAMQAMSSDDKMIDPYHNKDDIVTSGSDIGKSIDSLLESSSGSTTESIKTPTPSAKRTRRE